MLTRIVFGLVAAVVMAGAAWASTAEDDVYTLYRNSVTAPGMRVHVATFDAMESGRDHNLENCNVAADLFRQQPGALTRFWCERGRYRK